MTSGDLPTTLYTKRGPAKNEPTGGNLKRQGIDRIAVSEERITCGLAQLTAGKERVTCATINYTRSNCATVATIPSLGPRPHPGRNEKIPTHPIPHLLPRNPQE